MQRHVLFLILGFTINLCAQEKAVVEDLKYLEDQFYLGITYNIILNKPNGVTQSNFSYGLMGGFIKDLPLNRRRNFAIGLGLGYAYNNYYSNLFVNETENDLEYIVLDSDTSYKRNKLDSHVIEMPIEIRWRTSTPSDYKFWRIYAGMKLGYVVGSRSKFVSNTARISFNNPDIRKFRYGLMLNFGYSTVNVHAYYALSNLFNDNVNTVEGESIEFRPLRIGIIFYIL
ncbi:MAG: PorT family protein [Eudoraea sp.]|nr:PorT family protein [Eudoraea sp.]